MNFNLQMVFIFASVITFLFVIKKIQKHGLNIDDAVVWILWSIILLVISIFPQIPSWISSKLGFISTSNFVLSAFVFFLYIMLFAQTAEISKLKDKQKELIQKLSIKEYEDSKKNQE